MELNKDEKLSDLEITLGHIGEALDAVNKMKWYKDRGDELKEAGGLLDKAYDLVREAHNKEDV